MIPNQQIWAAVLFYGAAQGLMVSVALLFLRRGRRAANILLSAVVFTATFSVASWFLVATGLMAKVPFMVYGPLFLGTALGPLFYFYTKTLLRPDYKLKILLAVVLIATPDLLRFLDILRRGIYPADLIEMYGNWRQGTEYTFRRFMLIKPTILTSYLLLFLYLAWRQIRLAEATFRDQHADGARRHVAWLKVLNVGLCLFSASVVVFLLNLFIYGKWLVHMEYIESLVRCLIIQSAAFAAFFLPEAFTRNVAELVNGKRRAPIDDATAARYLRALDEYMDTEKPYRIEDLRMADLAKNLSISAHVLSQLINERLQTNFSDYVNKYRVEETQAQMENSDSEYYTLLAIARDAGFNSKTSFYRAFRKHVGMSPSEYRGRLKEAGRAASS
jgi:AraC-like DNA-binding protein